MRLNGRETKTAAALLVALGGLACSGSVDPPAQSTTTLPARTVRTAEVLREGRGEAFVPATLRARRRATLAARVPASVVELPHREGEAVAQGAIVARLDDAALQAAVAAAEAGLTAAEADRTRAEALLAKGAATPRERDQAVAHAAAARAALSAAQDSRSYAVLRAPFAGRIASRPVDVGDVVNPGQPLIEIEGRGGLEVEATVDARLIAQIKPGAELWAHVDGFDAPIPVRVRSVSPAGDPTTHRFELRADVPAREGLRSGLFARLALPSASREVRLVVPTRALFSRGGLEGVFVAVEGHARLRWVAPGRASGELTEVRAGLDEGERVVLDPEGLEDGTPLKENG